MSSEMDITDPRLDELAELSLAMARDLQAAAIAARDIDAKIRLVNAFARISRCVRMSIALAMRLRRGEPLAPGAGDAADAERDVEREETLVEERPERPERLDIYEPLFDRLPAGDLPAQIATIARSLGRAAAVLPEPQARAYRARCDALAGERRPLPLRSPQDGSPPDPRRGLLSGAALLDLARSRGPPGRSG